MVDLLWLTALAASLPAGANPSPDPATASVGSTVLADAEGLWIVERNARALVRANLDGHPSAALELGDALGQVLAAPGHGVFVADGAADRIVRVESTSAPAVTQSVSIAEPYGLSLSPDGKLLLATSVADHALVAFDAESLGELWRVELAAEPRPVTIDSSGGHAAVGFLSLGSVATVDLESPEHPVRWSSLEPRAQLRIEEDEWDDGLFTFTVRPNRFAVPTETGRRYARSAFAMRFLASDQLVTAHHLAMPQLRRTPGAQSFNSYGGSIDVPPVRYRLAVHRDPTSPAGERRAVKLGVHQPRALGYDAGSDTLYVGGFGDDEVQAIAEVSLASAHIDWSKKIASKDCGIDGIAFEGKALFVHCALTRNIIRLGGDLHSSDNGDFAPDVHTGPELAASARTEQVERGARLFRKGGDRKLSGDGSLACSTCHPTGRPDGLSWRLGDSILQTPMLSGRVAKTAPYKWDGTDATLKSSIRHTIRRIGGSPDDVRSKDIEALAAYVESLPAPRGRADVESDAVRRGAKLFASAELQCADCHSGDAMADGEQYPLAGPLPATDTPSLVGLGHTAPYYHDGSALTLAALVTDRGSVHDMADMSALSSTEQDDLVAFLSSL